MTKCVNAQLGLRIDTTGECRHCCMQYGSLSKTKNTPLIKGKTFNISVDSFKDILESDHSKEIRDALNNGEQHPACHYCWQEEAAGRDSKRIRDNRKYSNLLDKNLQGPAFLDISMGTTCNIKCRTCGPFNSSQWNAEWKDAGYFTGSDSEYKKFLISVNHGFDDDSLFWSEFANNIPNVIHLDFYGGEPFLVKKQWELMKSAVEQDIAKNITVHYNTNGTVWDESKLEILKHFKQVIIDFSIDGIGDKLYYIRYPAEWNVVLENFLKIQEIQKIYPNFHSSVCCTVSTFNIFYIDEIMEFFSSHTKNLYLNLVHGPQYQCIKNIPAAIKEKISNKLRQTVKPEWAGYHFFESTIDFMNSESCNDNLWNKFLTTTAWHDNYRNQNFKITFKEFYNLIKEEGYEVSVERQ